MKNLEKDRFIQYRINKTTLAQLSTMKDTVHDGNCGAQAVKQLLLNSIGDFDSKQGGIIHADTELSIIRNDICSVAQEYMNLGIMLTEKDEAVNQENQDTIEGFDFIPILTMYETIFNSQIDFFTKELKKSILKRLDNPDIVEETRIRYQNLELNILPHLHNWQELSGLAKQAQNDIVNILQNLEFNVNDVMQLHSIANSGVLNAQNIIDYIDKVSNSNSWFTGYELEAYLHHHGFTRDNITNDSRSGTLISYKHYETDQEIYLHNNSNAVNKLGTHWVAAELLDTQISNIISEPEEEKAKDGDVEMIAEEAEEASNEITQEITQEIVQFASVLEQIRNNTITSVIIEYTIDLSKEDIHLLAEALKTNTSVVRIALCHNHLKDEGAISIAQAIKANRLLPLKQLNLRGNQIGYEGSKELVETLKTNTSIESLGLASNNIQAAGATAFAEILQSSNSIQSLDLSYNNIGAAGVTALAEGLKANNFIKRLDLRGNQIKTAGAMALAGAIKANSDLPLESLDLENNHLGTEGAIALLKALKNNARIVRLELGGNGIKDEGTLALVELLENSNSIQRLGLSSNGIEDEGTLALSRLLKTNTSIRCLDLSSNNIGAEAIEDLVDTIAANSELHLQSLNLSGNYIEDEELVAIARMIKAKPSLQELDLAENNFGGEGAVTLAAAMCANPSFRKLNLTENAIEDKGAVALADVIKSNTKLHKLLLMESMIEDKGAEALADALKFTKSLQDLDLSANLIEDEGVIALAKAIKINKSLKKLDLSGNPIEDKGVEALAEAITINNSIKYLDLSSPWHATSSDSIIAIINALKINKSIISLTVGNMDEWENVINFIIATRDSEQIEKQQLDDVLLKVARSDTDGVEVRYLIENASGKYQFSVNATGEKEGDTIAKYYAHNPDMLQWLVAQGYVPRGSELLPGTANANLRALAADSQSVHDPSATRATRFCVKKLLSDLGESGTEQKLNQEADTIITDFQLLQQRVNAFRNCTPIKNISQQEADNRRQKLLEDIIAQRKVDSVSKKSIEEIFTTVINILSNNYLQKNAMGKYMPGTHAVGSYQYDYINDGKITLPQLIAGVKLHIENSNPSAEEIEAIYVDWIEKHLLLQQEGAELLQAFSAITGASVNAEELNTGTKCHAFLAKCDKAQIKELFEKYNNISAKELIQINKLLEFVLQLHMAATEYGEKGGSACFVGITAQVVDTLVKTDQSFIEDLARHEAAITDYITKINIENSNFIKEKAGEFIKAITDAKLDGELRSLIAQVHKKMDFSKITEKQAKICAMISKLVEENIKDYLPKFTDRHLSGAEYKIVFQALSDSNQVKEAIYEEEEPLIEEHQAAIEAFKQSHEKKLMEQKLKQLKMKIAEALEQIEKAPEKVKEIFAKQHEQTLCDDKEKAIIKFYNNFNECKNIIMKEAKEESKESDNIWEQSMVRESEQIVKDTIKLMISNYLHQTAGYDEADLNILPRYSALASQDHVKDAALANEAEAEAEDTVMLSEGKVQEINKLSRQIEADNSTQDGLKTAQSEVKEVAKYSVLGKRKAQTQLSKIEMAKEWIKNDSDAIKLDAVTKESDINIFDETSIQEKKQDANKITGLTDSDCLSHMDSDKDSGLNPLLGEGFNLDEGI